MTLITEHLVSRFNSGQYLQSSSFDVSETARLMSLDIGHLLLNSLRQNDDAMVRLIASELPDSIYAFVQHIENRHKAIKDYDERFAFMMKNKVFCEGKPIDNITQFTITELELQVLRGFLWSEQNTEERLNDHALSLLYESFRINVRKKISVANNIIAPSSMDLRLIQSNKSTQSDWLDIIMLCGKFTDEPYLKGTFFHVSEIPINILSNPVLTSYRMMNDNHFLNDAYAFHKRKFEVMSSNPINFAIESAAIGYFSDFFDEFDGPIDYDALHFSFMAAFSNGRTVDDFVDYEIANLPFKCERLSDFEELIKSALEFNLMHDKDMSTECAGAKTVEKRISKLCTNVSMLRNVAIQADILVGKFIQGAQLSQQQLFDLEREAMGVLNWFGRLGPQTHKTNELDPIILCSRDLTLENIGKLLVMNLEAANELDNGVEFSSTVIGKKISLPLPTLTSMIKTGKLNQKACEDICSNNYMMRWYWPENYHFEFLMLSELMHEAINQHVSLSEKLDSFQVNITNYDDEISMLVHQRLNEEKRSLFDSGAFNNQSTDMSFLGTTGI